MIHGDHKAVVVGEAPGPKSDAWLPLWPLPASGTGGRLMKLAGIDNPREYLDAFYRLNVLQKHPGSYHNGGRRKDKWPVRESRAAAAVLARVLTGDKVVLLGSRVRSAFGFSAHTLPFLDWRYREDVQYACLPHPSGLNHWYNQGDNRSRAEAFLRDLLER